MKSRYFVAREQCFPFTFFLDFSDPSATLRAAILFSMSETCGHTCEALEPPGGELEPRRRDLALQAPEETLSSAQLPRSQWSAPWQRPGPLCPPARTAQSQCTRRSGSSHFAPGTSASSPGRRICLLSGRPAGERIAGRLRHSSPEDLLMQHENTQS